MDEDATNGEPLCWHFPVDPEHDDMRGMMQSMCADCGQLVWVFSVPRYIKAVAAAEDDQ